MNSLRARTRSATAVLAGAGLILIGCSDPTGLEKRYAVSGTVTYNGAPLAKGNINFLPVDTAQNSRAATGTVENGRYSLTTALQDDGAFPGKYNVTVTSTEADYSQVKANAKGGSGHQDDVVKATRNAKSLVPKKYAMPDTSGLTADVQPKSNTFDFALKD